MDQQRTNLPRQEPTNPPDQNASAPLRAKSGGASQPRLDAFHQNTFPPALRGWAMWAALSVTLLGLLIAVIAWIIMGIALFASFSVSVNGLALVFLAPIIGGALCLPGVVLGLLATRQARKKGARLTLPVSLVSVATLVLVAGLLFGGLVAYPRYQLGLFAQSLQTHCGRVQQVLGQYQNLSPVELVSKAPQITATINQNQQMLQSDEAALNALSAPDDPDDQQLLDDCKTIISGTLNLPNLLKNPVGSAFQIQSLYTTFQDAQRLGTQLKQNVFSPFQPPPDY